MQMMQAPQLQQVSVSQIESKLKSKKELYQFLSTNIYYFKAILRGTKEYLKRDKVLVSAVPQIEGLTVEDLLKMAKGNPNVLKHLPVERDWVHMDRKWISDVIFTLDKQNFQAAINQAVKKRKERLEVSRNLVVEMRPEFAQALNSCLNYSSSHGRATSLMKSASKRKRTREELEEVKQEERDLKTDRHMFLQQVKRLREDKAQLESQLAQAQPSVQLGGAGDGSSKSKKQPQAFNI